MSEPASDIELAIENANEAYESAREYVEQIDESDMLRPNRVGIWSGKDLVIHIADWETQGARIINDLRAGQPEQWIPDGIEPDAFNEQRVKAHASLVLAEALDVWAQSHERFMTAYRDAGLDRDDILFGLTREHYRLHYPDFRHIKPFKALSDEDREQLLRDMETSHQTFTDLVGSIDDTALTEPNTIGIWSGKDLIAHLGHWQQAAIDLTRELENDRPGKWPGEDGSNINEWNESKVAETQDLSLDEVRDQQQQTYEALLDLMRTSPFATRSAGIGATEFHYGLHEEDFQSLKQ